MRFERVLTIPSADIKEACMGFHVGDTRAPDLTEAERNHLLGQCIDRNLLTSSLPPHSPLILHLPLCPASPGRPLSAGQLWPLLLGHLHLHCRPTAATSP
jgi:hypothetical protein